MGNIFKLFRKKSTPYEICIVCKSELNIKKDEHTENRYGYVEGAGQLCYDCYNSLEAKC